MTDEDTNFGDIFSFGLQQNTLAQDRRILVILVVWAKLQLVWYNFRIKSNKQLSFTYLQSLRVRSQDTQEYLKFSRLLVMFWTEICKSTETESKIVRVKRYTDLPSITISCSVNDL